MRLALGTAAPSPHLRGVLYALCAGTLWGISGAAAQVLFQHHGVAPQWLVGVRMLGSSAILLALLRPPLPRGHLLSLVIFGVAGLAAVQYTYFAAISLMGVALATFTQYLSLPMIGLWEGLVRRHHLGRRTLVAVTFALVGTALLLLASSGHGAGSRVSALGIAFGLASAVTAAFYSLYAVRLAGEVGPWRSNAWGFLFGGVMMSALAPPWSVHATGSMPAVVLLTLFVVVPGTLIPFSLYLAALRRVGATQAGTAVTVEPVSAALVSALFLGAVLGPIQYLGGAAILGAVFILRGAERTTAQD